MALWDLLTNAGNTIKNKGGQLIQGLTGKDNATGGAPQLQAVQLDDTGNIDPVKSLELEQETTPLSLSERVLGRTLTKDIQNVNPETGEAQLQTISSYRPGLFNDIAAGARENFNTGFATNNWKNNLTDAGRQKGGAYRIGEALGSIGRALESPLGRGLITAGIVGATGGNGLEALVYGGSAGVKNQQLRSADQLYRQQLKDNYGLTDEQLKNVHGYISKDDFSTLSNNIYKNQALQVRQAIANAKDKRTAQNLIFRAHNNGQLSDSEAQLQLQAVDFKFSDSKDGKPQLRASNSTRNADMNEELLPYKKYALQTAPQIAMGNLGLNQARFAYQQQQDAFDNAIKLRQLNGGTGLSKTDQKAYKENLSTLSDIDAGLKLIGENPNAYNWAYGIMGADIANRIDPKGVKTRTQIDNITAVYRKWLTGAQMSDAERKAYERFLPAPTDNAQIVTAKLQGMRDSIERKNNILMQSAKGVQNNNPLGLNL